MDVLGVYIYNATQDLWLQSDLKTWGPFYSAREFYPDDARIAEDIRLGIEGDDTTYTFAGLL